jgi:pimeloyl-ACP methyl ester carboxylesterase
MPVDGGGWAWKFDEDLPGTLKDVERSIDDYQNLTVRLGLIYGADSELFSQRTEAYMRELVPQDFPSVAVENAQHHLFLDQPLAFVDSLKQMLGDLGEQPPG